MLHTKINGATASLGKPGFVGCNRARGAFSSIQLPFRQCSTTSARIPGHLGPRHLSRAATIDSARGTAAHQASASSAAQHDASEDPAFRAFVDAAQGCNIVPVFERIFSDQLTPVLAYRCLVQEADLQSPSFLLESVVNGDQQGRYSYVGAMPAMEIIATKNEVTVLDHINGARKVTHEDDPMEVVVQQSRNWRPARMEGLPEVFTGGWVGYAGYDTVRYVYSAKLPFDTAPQDDRQLPDMHLALYNDVVVFDQATKIAYAISWVHLDPSTPLEEAYASGKARLAHLVEVLSGPSPPLQNASISLALTQRPASPGTSNMTEQEFLGAVEEAKEHIMAGDIFQLVLSQRFQRRTFAEPFEIYRALRVVNPSPYMVYMQCRGSIIVSSSPEILCKVDNSRIVTNRPLAGTRARGATAEADAALEQELLADAKEVAEHVMLVDLGRNDVGKVAVSGSVKVEKLMEIERYSHVMHISSTVTGQLLPELDCWDALRAALPAGTVSGAPKVRAMQIIDELEVNQRGPYGGGLGMVSFTGDMNMALALRTMVIPSDSRDAIFSYKHRTAGGKPRREWVVHLQAGAGLVADSVPEKEYEETINKAAALGRAVDLAEAAFVHSQH